MSRIGALFLLLCEILLFAPFPAMAITIPTVPVGNAGNANDATTGNLFGAVAYDYRIGTTEVTVGQYATFLTKPS
jgi:hypothetical protein